MTFRCDYCQAERPDRLKKDIITRRPSTGEWCSVMWVCDCTTDGVEPDGWCEDMGAHDGPVCPLCGTEPELCACGDEEWGACKRLACWERYDEERNSV